MKPSHKWLLAGVALAVFGGLIRDLTSFHNTAGSLLVSGIGCAVMALVAKIDED